MTEPRRDDPRLALLRHWLEHGLGWKDAELAPASADASFRRYFRITRPGGTCIAMDAPPDKENVEPYLAVAAMLADIGVHAPRVLDRNAADGFLLLTDLGSVTYLMELEDQTRSDALYLDAVAALVRMQARGGVHAGRLPPYDEKLLRFEMSLFTDWLLGRHLGIALDAAESRHLAAAFDRLVANALEQPRVFVHRDYHSRNLMVCAGANPGILDFQDAVHGPLTYDLVSLLRDCYIAWPQDRVVAWALEYRRQATAAGLACGTDQQQFLRWFDLMGVQRHLKASGIFARLWHRDGKPGYLPDVPRTLEYVGQACARHPDLAPLGQLVRERVLPAMQASLEARRA
ncbi:MAG TPA: phosphotransferase [Steroidobacteraceae bacterium]|nr:phosphotransferase [Steroidobacteraceae bacterium]HQR49531.1 phosphotransferase [Steroidobacteraceae bacterium]